MQRLNISFDQILNMTRMDERNYILENLAMLFQELVEHGKDNQADGVRKAIKLISLNSVHQAMRIPNDEQGMPNIKAT
jgi:hypothetical protein